MNGPGGPPDALAAIQATLTNGLNRKSKFAAVNSKTGLDRVK